MLKKLFKPNNFQPKNLLLCTDVYKMGHMQQYVPGCEKVYSYLQARSDKTFNQTVFFGLQYYLKEYLTKAITKDHVEEFLINCEKIVGPPSNQVKKQVTDLQKLGYIPLEIKAVEEGTVVPPRNVLMTMTNTHPDFYWTVGFFESLLLKIWYPTTVATASYTYKQVVDKYFNETVDKSMHVVKPFMVHDFGYRGDSSEESAVISGMSHLLSFNGSDTVPAYNGCVKYYNMSYLDPLHIMNSIPASEHSVMCSFGRENELDAFKHMLMVYPDGMVSIVSDTYDLWNVFTNYASVLKNDILARNGRVVFRPDSGNPTDIICGDPNADPLSPAGKGCIRLLDEMFGSSVNAKGYRVLNEKVGLIYGDGMRLERYTNTLERLKQMGYASSNLVIGVGSLLRYHSRDTLGFAIKATKVQINGIERAIMKDPITDHKKKSHKGYLCLKKENDQYITLDDVSSQQEKEGLLRTVFRNGKILIDENFDTIRNRVRSHVSI